MRNRSNKYILALLLSIALFNNNFWGYGYTSVQKDLHALVKSLNSKYKIPNINDKKLIFMLRYIDFGCQLCLQNFFELCDSLGRLNNRQFNVSVYLIFLEDHTDPDQQYIAMKEWTKSCGLVYPLTIVNQEFFNKCGIEHSSLIILGENGDLIQTGEIPFNWLTLKNILMDKK